MSTDDTNSSPRHDAEVERDQVAGASRSVVKRRAIIAAAVVAGLALIAGVPMLLVSLVPTFERATPVEEEHNEGGLLPLPDSSTDPTGVTGTDLTGTTTVQETSSPKRSPSLTSSVAASATAAAFTPTAYEAESSVNTLGGSAWAAAYSGASGGRIVRNLGDWDSARGAGWLRFNQVTAPADGTYVLTFFTVHIDGESTRSTLITVSSGTSMTVAVKGGSACCGINAVKVVLKKGENTVTFSNTTAHAPSVDRIVISRP